MEYGAAGILYDCREAERDIDLKDEAAVRAGVIDAYGDSHWVDVDGIVAAILDPRTAPAVAYRFYLNNIQENADGWLVKAEWDACLEEDDPIRPGDQIAVGFDGSLRGDATGLVGASLRDGKLFVLGLWENPRDPKRPDWEVDILAVEAAVKRAFETYRVELVLRGPRTGRKPSAAGLSPTETTEYWTNKPMRMCEATERLHSAVVVGDVKHDGDPNLTRHCLNAVTREVPQGLLICKTPPGQSERSTWRCAESSRSRPGRTQLPTDECRANEDVSLGFEQGPALRGA